MARLNVLVEGDSEETVVNGILRPHLADKGVFLLGARRVETGRRRTGVDRRGVKIYRGGMTNYERVKRDVLRWLKQENSARDLFLTTMFDLYALPEDFPGFAEAERLPDAETRVKHLEQALSRDIPDPRFLPYLQLHEFEALLLCDPAKFAEVYEGTEAAAARLAAMVDSFPSPERIDGGSDTAPSKRIIAEYPAYEREKALVGPLIFESIGLAVMRSRCPHFAEWLGLLESLQPIGSR